LFGFLKISPPLNKEALDDKQKEIKAKLESYVKEGEEKLKEEEEKLGEGVLVEEEEEPVEEYNDRRRGGYRGGRGGRGHYRGTADGGRRPAGGFRKREDEETYGDNSDEDYPKQETQKSKRQNKKEDLNMDDNNFPTL